MPKIHGTRKELAKELRERLVNGPSFSSSTSPSAPLLSPEEACKQYRRWAESWILEPLCKLIPELKGASPSEIRSEAKRCSNCKKQKPDVKKRVDPYREDVENKKVYCNLCDDCEKSAKEAI